MENKPDYSDLSDDDANSSMTTAQSSIIVFEFLLKFAYPDASYYGINANCSCF